MKVFVASMILLVGVFVAGIQTRPSLDLRKDAALDPKLVAAPLPAADATPPNEVDAALAAALPTPPDEPQLDPGKEKYAQAYPPPILVVDPRLTSTPAGKEPEPPKEKPFPAIDFNFKPLHQFTGPAPIRPEEFCASPEPAPMPVSAPPSKDAMLPLFHFAENVDPLRPDDEPAAPPENPFDPPSEPQPQPEPSAVFAVTSTATRRLRPLVPPSSMFLLPLEPMDTLRRRQDATGQENFADQQD